MTKLSKEKLQQLDELADAFNTAAEKLAVSKGPATISKIQSSATAKEVEELTAISPNPFDLLFGSDEPTKADLEKSIRAVEIGAAIISRVIPEAELAAIIPEEQKTEANATAFKAAKAPTLAKLYAPKA